MKGKVDKDHKILGLNDEEDSPLHRLVNAERNWK